MKWFLHTASMILLLGWANNLYAQTGFEPGYFIDNSDKRIECTILNKDAARSPEEFSYKLPGESEPRKAGINEVKEFTAGSNTYVRHEGKIDVSSQNQAKLSQSNEPEWEIRTVFLKLIVNGKAKLYRFRNADLELYFYSVDNSPIEQLVYKKVDITAANSGRNADVRPVGFAENMFYKSQLAARVSCGPSIPAARMPAYQTSSLQKHFERYNECNGEVVVRQKSNNKSLHLTAGYDFGNLRTKENPYILVTTSDQDYGYQVGLAGELGLPFNNGKWSIVAQPTYQASSGSNPYRHHQSIEIPAGVRHYFFLPSFDLFLDGFAVPDFAISYETSHTTIDFGIALSAAAGAGVRMNRLSLEGRYYLRRTYGGLILTQYSKMSVIVGYRLTKGTGK